MYICICMNNTVRVSTIGLNSGRTHPHGVVSDALVGSGEDRRLELEDGVRGRGGGQAAEVLLGQVDQLRVVHRTSGSNYKPTK